MKKKTFKRVINITFIIFFVLKQPKVGNQLLSKGTKIINPSPQNSLVTIQPPLTGKE